MSETICWSHEGEKECFWQREWKRLYHIACDMTKSSEELQELLDKLDRSGGLKNTKVRKQVGDL